MTKVHFIHDVSGSTLDKQLTFLSDIAKGLGFDVSSLDYGDLDEPGKKAVRLYKSRGGSSDDIFVGFGEGAWVANGSAMLGGFRGLFLLAPTQPPTAESFCPLCAPEASFAEIVHGWDDEIAPYGLSVLLAKDWGCTLHLLDEDHSFSKQQSQLGIIFSSFLSRVG